MTIPIHALHDMGKGQEQMRQLGDALAELRLDVGCERLLSVLGKHGLDVVARDADAHAVVADLCNEMGHLREQLSIARLHGG